MVQTSAKGTVYIEYIPYTPQYRHYDGHRMKVYGLTDEEYDGSTNVLLSLTVDDIHHSVPIIKNLFDQHFMSNDGIYVGHINNLRECIEYIFKEWNGSHYFIDDGQTGIRLYRELVTIINGTYNRTEEHYAIDLNKPPPSIASWRASLGFFIN